MFRIINRYVLSQYVQIFLICFLSLYGLFVVIDAFGHLDHFVDHSKVHGGLFAALGKYYGYRSLAFFDKTSGILALIAAMFTVTWTQRHNEMTALLAAGISRLQVLRPVIVVAILFSLFAATVREVIIPRVRHELAVDTKNLAGDAPLDLQSRYDNQTDILLGGESVLVGQQLIEHPNFVLPPGLAAHGKQLTAATAQYVAASGARPAGFWLRGVTQPTALLKQRSLADRDGKPVVVTPVDDPGLAKDELFVVSDVPFELLAGGSSWRDYASTSEIVQQLASPSVELGADVQVAVHSRLLHPLADITLLFLGLPLVVSGGNRSPYVAIGMCVLVVTGFFMVTLGAQSLGASGWIRPALAAWAPLLVFVPVAVGLSDSLRK